MKTKIFSLILFAGLFIFMAGCGEETTNVDVINDEGGAVVQLDYRNFDQAASDMIQSLLGSGRLKKADGSRYIIATGRIINDTTQRIDTDQLMMKIETELTNSGLAAFTAVVGPGSDQTLLETRELRDSDEFDTTTTAKKHTLLAPELTIAGKIIQRIIRVNKSKQRIEYYFQLKLSEVDTGITFWQYEVPIVKQTNSKSLPM